MAKADLCNGRGCDESVADPCTGELVDCSCAAAEGCVDKAYIEGATKSECRPASEASLLGGYVVRTHQFTQLSSFGVQKAQTVSLVRIRKRGSAFEIEDRGCVAATSPTASIGPAYFNIPAAVAPLTVTGTSWTRQKSVMPMGVGFTAELPSFCSAAGAAPSAAPDYDTYLADYHTSATPGSGSQKPWLDGDKTCTCPTTPTCTFGTISEACLPTESTGAPTEARDCRINDIDNNGKPGYTVIVSLGASLSTVSYGDVIWNGFMDPDGKLTGSAPNPSPFYRNFVGCTGTTCALIGSTSDQTCGESFNRVDFRKVSPTTFSGLTCQEFYNLPLAQVAAADTWGQVSSAVKQTAIDAYFGGVGTCTASTQCDPGSVCNGGKCWPLTSEGACDSDAEDECNSANPGNPAGITWRCRGNLCIPKNPAGMPCTN
jgi:hypothetical protein